MVVTAENSLCGAELEHLFEKAVLAEAAVNYLFTFTCSTVDELYVFSICETVIGELIPGILLLCERDMEEGG